MRVGRAGGSLSVMMVYVDWDSAGLYRHVYGVDVAEGSGATGEAVVASVPGELDPWLPQVCFTGPRGAVVWLDGRDLGAPVSLEVYLRQLQVCD